MTATRTRRRESVMVDEKGWWCAGGRRERLPPGAPAHAVRITAAGLRGRRGRARMPQHPDTSQGSVLESAGVPGSGDRERDPWTLDVREQPLAVRAVAGARELGSAEVPGDAVPLAGEDHVVLGELEDLAVDRQPVQELLAAAVLAQHEAAARADGDVVRSIEHRRARRLEQERHRL